MTFDLWMLVGAILLGLVHVGGQSFSYKKQVGNAYTLGPRDEEEPPRGIAGRYARALRNFLETFSLFAAAIMLVHAADKLGTLSVTGSALYLAGRTAYLPLYVMGIRGWRTVAWQTATIGIVLVVAQIFF